MSKPQIVHYPVTESARPVRTSVDPEAWEYLLGGGGPSDCVTPLQHEHLVTGPREVCGCDETVVPRPDDDGVVEDAHRGVSARIRSAAKRPDAPVMPPAGWVPEPA